ncbi:MAG TPA: multicopper oxidase family protein [Gemmatimonadales bacterium]|nr:multicopper oxidase family protein [Gemmatimonadales bacterium]
MPRGVTGAALAGLLLAAAGPLAAQAGFCADSSRPAPAARDLYCVHLVPVPGLAGAGGVVELRPAATPFGLAVTADGALRHDLVATVRGLPAPGTLGPFTTFVAWLADPGFASVTRLGPVRNGTVPLGESALDKFLLLVTAEASDTGPAPLGPRVLRGLSPSTRVGAHGIVAMAPALRRMPGPGHEHRADGESAAAWRMPPMLAGFPMMPGLGGLVPPARPWLPAGPDAPPARPREALVLRQGDSLTLTAAPVRKMLAGREVVLYGFNGQVPGPLLVVPEAATVTVTFVNHTALPTTIHWHGLRHDNRFDGVPHLTQDPVPPGGSFRYEVRFPDAGLYWYHPHHREDLLQDAGLAGNILVRSRAPDWLGPAHREEVLLLDDLLADDAGLLPWGEETPTHTLMGRFGNLLLVNGEPGWELAVDRGEVVRLWFTNVSNTRTWNVSFPGARMKAVASDLGRFDREEWVESVVLGPAERYAVDVRFGQAGAVPLVNRVHALDHIGGRFVPLVDTLGLVTVRERAAAPDLGRTFEALRRPGGEAAEAAALRGELARPATHELVLTLEAKGLPFGIERMLRADTGYAHPLEFTGTMPEMDWLPTAAQARWILRDPATGLENEAIHWRFRRGERVRLRLRNDRSVIHPMAHPIHLHGQRFLVLARNGVPSERVVWKDTAIVPVGGTLELLVEMTNPGKWMVHCHIAEHLSAGMAAVITVE